LSQVTVRLLGIGLLAVLMTVASDTRADEKVKHFDGEWNTVLSCPNSNGALGYSFDFPSIVKDGVLHGEKGEKGKPGWFQIDGPIAPDGHASIYASGLVGAAEAAVGRRPAGTQYSYHIETAFIDASGTGNRVEGRPCTVTFTRKH
jgi:hypothetical protein